MFPRFFQLCFENSSSDFTSQTVSCMWESWLCWMNRGLFICQKESQISLNKKASQSQNLNWVIYLYIGSKSLSSWLKLESQNLHKLQEKIVSTYFRTSNNKQYILKYSQTKTRIFMTFTYVFTYLLMCFPLNLIISSSCKHQFRAGFQSIFWISSLWYSKAFKISPKTVLKRKLFQ